MRLMGAPAGPEGVRSGFPLSPDEWMMKGGVVRRPFTKNVVRFPGLATILHKMKHNRVRFPYEEIIRGDTTCSGRDKPVLPIRLVGPVFS